MKKFKLKPTIISFVILVCVFVVVLCIKTFSDAGIKKYYENVEFVKVIDGDTAYFKINDEEVKCRFLAIDTPELTSNDPYAKEATELTLNALENAKSIKLGIDLKSDEYDKYERMLVWVFVDNVLLQEELVSNGLAKVRYVYDDYKYADKLYKLEEKARANKVGVWSLD